MSTDVLVTQPDMPSPEVVRRAAGAIVNGGVIVYPTDTIYGLGCDAMNPSAIERIYAIKGRKETNPVLLLARDRGMVEDLTGPLPESAAVLAEKFWPGPLTMVLRAKPRPGGAMVSPAGTVAVRVPASRFCIDLITACGRLIVSTSANLSGEPVPGSIDEIIGMFREEVDLIVNAGNAVSTAPSTLVDCTGETVRIIREGAIKSGDIHSRL